MLSLFNIIADRKDFLEGERKDMCLLCLRGSDGEKQVDSGTEN